MWKLTPEKGSIGTEHSFIYSSNIVVNRLLAFDFADNKQTNKAHLELMKLG